MTTPAAGRAWKEWLPVVSFAVMLIGAILAGGGYIAQLQDNTRRIAALESKTDSRDDKLNTISDRTARIEAKLEVLVPTQRPVQP